MKEVSHRILRDNRDFPRQDVEARVRIICNGIEERFQAPAVITDLSLGGARLSSSTELQLDQEIQLLPLLEVPDDSDFYKRLSFKVVWQSLDESARKSHDNDWDFYGLKHSGTVLDILNSWLGHLLLRRFKPEDLIIERREHRRLRLPEHSKQEVHAVFSHDKTTCRFTLLDLAPGGVLVQGERGILVGMHLTFLDGVLTPSSDRDPQAKVPIHGTIIDAYIEKSVELAFYRIAFDPDSEINEEVLLEWAIDKGGTFES